MSAFVIVDIAITDPVRFEEYKRLAMPTIAMYGGKYIVRGGRVDVLEGERQPGRIVVLEFPSVAVARSWWDSKEYAPAKAIRQAAAQTEMILVEGV